MRKKTALISLTTLLFFVITGQCFADIPAQFEQAEKYKKTYQYDQAEAIYQQIITDYPGTDYVFQAQKNLAILYVAWDKQPEADGALQELLTNFSNHRDIAQAVHEIAGHCRWLKKYKQSKQLCQYVVDH